MNNEEKEKLKKIKQRLSGEAPIFVASEVGWLIARLEEARDDQAMLRALQNAGVDNWELYEVAVDAFEEETNPEHKS